MGKRLLAAVALCALACGPASPRLAAQQAEELARKAAEYIRAHFKDQSGIRAAVTRLENRSTLSGPALERIYQLIYSHLGEFNENRFLDLLIDIQDGTARFNLSKAYQLDFLIDLKFMQQREKTGIGIAVYSRRLDRIVGIRYVEAALPAAERRLLAVREYEWRGLGFARRGSFEVRADLLDVAGAEIDGVPQSFFFYPESIEIFRSLEQGLEKAGELKLSWGAPYYPSLHPEGRLFLAPGAGAWILCAGANFCGRVKLFRQNAARSWQEEEGLPFVPLGSFSLNGKSFIAGAPYEWGKNYFQDRLLFVPNASGVLDLQNQYERRLPAFFAMAFAREAGELLSLHTLDAAYQYGCTAADMTTALYRQPERGSALAILDDAWLAMSNAQSGGDRLFFCKLEAGVPKPLYENDVEGEIVFIAAGSWRTLRGFFVCIQQGEGDEARRSLEFWSKSDE